MQNKYCLAALLALSACGPLVTIGAQGPAPQRFTLTSAQNEAALAALPAIRVEDFETSADLATTRIAVRVGAQEVRYVVGGIWTDKPVRLIRNLLADQVRARSSGVVLAGNQLEVPTAFRIGGRLTGFQAEGAGKLATHVSVQAEIFVLQGPKIVASQTFQQRRALTSDRPADMINSFNEAANILATEAATWIATTVAQTK